MKKFLSLILAAALVMTFAAGCGDKGGNNGEEAGLDEKQYVNTSIIAEPTTFDSVIATDTVAMNVLNNMMEPLVRLIEHEDRTVEPVPAGAEKYEVSDDKTVWTFHLRDNAWSDGQPVTAHDYEYGIKRVLDPNVGAAYSYIMMPIKNALAVNTGEKPLDELGVKTLNDKTLEITLEYPTSYFLGLVCHSVMLPQRQDIVEKYGDQYGADVDKLVYCGPFMCTQWVHNSEIVLSKNENYWDKDNVKLENINYKIIKDENAVYNSLENGSIDLANTSTKEWTETFKQFDELEYYESDNSSVFYQYYNQYDELFSNAKVRKAFAIAVDREEMNEVVYDGQNKPAFGFIPPQVCVGETEYRGAVEKDAIQKLIEENPDPKALLVDGLKELGMDPDPTKLTVEMQLGGTDQWTKKLGDYMQQVYKEKLGVNVELKMLEWGVFIDNYYNYEYQLAMMQFGADFNDPLSMLSSAESSQDGFCIGYGDERIDKLIYAATAEMDTAKKIEMIKEIEDIFIYRDCCVSPLNFSVSHSFTYDYLQGLAFTNFATNGYKYAYTRGRSAR